MLRTRVIAVFLALLPAGVLAPDQLRADPEPQDCMPTGTRAPPRSSATWKSRRRAT
jgi:hypothetical protein